MVTAQGLLTKPEEFADIIVRTGKEGAAIVRIRDIGRVELAKRDYSMSSRMNGKTATTIGVYQQPGANAVATSSAVRARMQELKAKFPTGLDYKIVLDTSEFTLFSIDKVVHTFFEAVMLVVLVVFVFLQSLRATIIPILAVPVSIVGTFAGMHLLGFSINMLTMFGMILAIGLVVDDAIVVVENVEVNITKKGLAPLDAAKQAMTEIAGALISIVLVLLAVFLPVAFLGGVTGHAVQAVRHHHRDLDGDLRHHGADPVARARRHHHQGPSRREESLLPRVRARLRAHPARLRRRGRATPSARGRSRSSCSAAVIAGILFFFRILPSSFVPDEDQGYFFVVAQISDTASLNVTGRFTAAARKDHPRRSGGAGPGYRQRLQLHRRPAEQQRGDHVRPAQAVSRPRHDPTLSSFAALKRLNAQFFGRKEGRGVRAQPAGDSRPGHYRRVRVLHPEPWLGRHARHRSGGAGVPRQGPPAPRAARV